MLCPQCKGEVPGNVKFCPECGFRMQGTSSPQLSFTGQKTYLPEEENGLGDGASFTGQKTLDKIEPSSPAQEGIAYEEGKERYKIVEKIGEGGMGVVYRAQDAKLGRIVALKRLIMKEQENRLGVERFLREAQAIAQLNHRNIVAVHDIGKDDLGYYIVMEYIEGVVLSVYIRKKEKLPLPEAMEIIAGVGSALSYAHKRNIVHRDIKPGNIMIGPEQVAKILDFGLAKVGTQSQLSLSGYGMGTMDYAAPEQKRDAKNVDHRSDIYSLGATLYEMVTGEIPKTIRSDRMPEEIAGIVLKCLEERPENRYFSVDEILRDCEGAKEGKGKKKKIVLEEEPEGTCHACGSQNRPEAKYCKKCGVGLFESCASCGKEIRIGIEFCEHCGVNVLKHLAKGREFRSNSPTASVAAALEHMVKGREIWENTSPREQ